MGEIRAYHVPPDDLDGVDATYPPATHHLRQETLELLYLIASLLGQAYQRLWLVLGYDGYGRSLPFICPSHPGS